LFTPVELECALGRIRQELLPSLESIIERHAVDYHDIDEEPSEHFQDFSNDMENFRDFFEGLDNRELVEAFERGQQLVEEAVEGLKEWRSEQEEEVKRNKAAEQAVKEMDEEARAGEEEMIDAMIAEYEQKGTSSAIARKPEAPSQARVQIPTSTRSIFDDVDA
jgi:hypothetical protein